MRNKCRKRNLRYDDNSLDEQNKGKEMWNKTKFVRLLQRGGWCEFVFLVRNVTSPSNRLFFSKFPKGTLANCQENIYMYARNNDGLIVIKKITNRKRKCITSGGKIMCICVSCVVKIGSRRRPLLIENDTPDSSQNYSSNNITWASQRPKCSPLPRVFFPPLRTTSRYASSSFYIT